MARLALFISFALALASFPSGALAGPACARKNFKLANCVSKCASKWGWTGAMMNTDPWGSVVQKTDTNKNWDTVIAEACGVAVTSTPSSSTSTTLTTGTAIPAPAAAAGAKPTLSSSSISSSLTLPLSSSTTSSSSATVATTSSSTSSTKPTTTSKPSSIAPVQTLGLVASTRSKSSTTARPATTIKSTTEEKSTPVSPKQPAPNPTTAVSTPAPSADNSGSGSTSNADIQAYLSAHNSVRAQHGDTALTWSVNLASKAQEWANKCVFQHSGGSLGPFGENLAAGTGSSYGIAAAVKSWTDEVSEYNPSNPVPSHFTQVVWKGTSQVGCAVQSCSGIFAASFGPAKFFVCEYSAQGNVIGQFAQNVQV